MLDPSNRHVENVGSADLCVVLYNTVSRTVSYRFVKDDHISVGRQPLSTERRELRDLRLSQEFASGYRDQVAIC